MPVRPRASRRKEEGDAGRAGITAAAYRRGVSPDLAHAEPPCSSDYGRNLECVMRNGGRQMGPLQRIGAFPRFPAFFCAILARSACAVQKLHPLEVSKLKEQDYGNLEAGGAAGTWHRSDRRMCLVVLRPLEQRGRLERHERQSKRVYPLSKLLIAPRIAVRLTSR